MNLKEVYQRVKEKIAEAEHEYKEKMSDITIEEILKSISTPIISEVEFNLASKNIRDASANYETAMESIAGREPIMIGNLRVGTLYKQPLKVQREDGSTMYVGNLTY